MHPGTFEVYWGEPVDTIPLSGAHRNADEMLVRVYKFTGNEWPLVGVVCDPAVESVSEAEIGPIQEPAGMGNWWYQPSGTAYMDPVFEFVEASFSVTAANVPWRVVRKKWAKCLCD